MLRPTASPSRCMPPESAASSRSSRTRRLLLWPLPNPCWRPPSNDRARGSRTRYPDHPYPDPAAAPRWSKADHDAGGRGSAGTEAEPRRDAGQGARARAPLAAADRERAGEVDHRPRGARGRHGRLCLSAPAAHLPRARHRGSDPGRPAAEGAEARRDAGEWTACMGETEKRLGIRSESCVVRPANHQRHQPVVVRLGKDTARLSYSLHANICKIGDASGGGIVGVAKDRDVDDPGGSRPRPQMPIDREKIDPFAMPLADIVGAAVRDVVRKRVDILVIARLQQLIAPNDLDVSFLAVRCNEGDKQPRRMIVTFTGALVDLADDRLFNEPTPFKYRVSDQIDIGMAKEHRSAGLGLATQRWNTDLGSERERCCLPPPERPVIPTGGKRVEREGVGEIHHDNLRLAVRKEH